MVNLKYVADQWMAVPVLSKCKMSLEIIFQNQITLVYTAEMTR
jgi:hypothetical protein